MSVALNAATPVELAGCCPFVDEAYSVGYTDFLGRAGDPDAALAEIPREWDYVLDDDRSRQPAQLQFEGMRRYYQAAHRHFRPRIRPPVARVVLQRRSLPLGPPGHQPLSRLHQMGDQPDTVDDEGEPRTPSMTRARVEDDLPELVEAARALVEKGMSYEWSLRAYFPRLLEAYDGDRWKIFSFDGIHRRFI